MINALKAVIGKLWSAVRQGHAIDPHARVCVKGFRRGLPKL
jgi:hypothetical protein